MRSDEPAGLQGSGIVDALCGHGARPSQEMPPSKSEDDEDGLGELDARLGGMDLRVSVGALIRQLVHEQAKASVHLEDLQRDVSCLLGFRPGTLRDSRPSGDAILGSRRPEAPSADVILGSRRPEAPSADAILGSRRPAPSSGSGLAGSRRDVASARLQRSSSDGTSGLGTSIATHSTNPEASTGDQPTTPEADELLTLLDTIEAHGRRLQNLNLRILTTDGSCDMSESGVVSEGAGKGATVSQGKRSPGCEREVLRTQAESRNPAGTRVVSGHNLGCDAGHEICRMCSRTCDMALGGYSGPRGAGQGLPDRLCEARNDQMSSPSVPRQWTQRRERLMDDLADFRERHEADSSGGAAARAPTSLPNLRGSPGDPAALLLTEQLLQERDTLLDQLADLQQVAARSQLHVASLQSRLHQLITSPRSPLGGNHGYRRSSGHHAASPLLRSGPVLVDRMVQSAPSLQLTSRIPQPVPRRTQVAAASGGARPKGEAGTASRETQTRSMVDVSRRSGEFGLSRGTPTAPGEIRSRKSTQSVGVCTSEHVFKRSVGVGTSPSIAPSEEDGAPPADATETSSQNRPADGFHVGGPHTSSYNQVRASGPPAGDRHKIPDIGGGAARVVPNRESVSSILREMSPLALQRQLLQQLVEAETLRAKVVSLGSRVEARASLSEREQAAASRGRPSDVETEELRLQLEVRNIELEGTRARLRQLEGQLEAALAPKTPSAAARPEDCGPDHGTLPVNTAQTDRSPGTGASGGGLAAAAAPSGDGADEGSERREYVGVQGVESGSASVSAADAADTPQSGAYHRPMVSPDSRSPAIVALSSELRPGTPAVPSTVPGGRSSPRRPPSRNSGVAQRPSSRTRVHAGSRTPTGSKTGTGSRTPTRAGTPTRPGSRAGSADRATGSTSRTAQSSGQQKAAGKASKAAPAGTAAAERGTASAVRPAAGVAGRRSVAGSGGRTVSPTATGPSAGSSPAEQKEKVRRRVSLSSDQSAKIPPTQSLALGQILTALSRGHSPRSSARKAGTADDPPPRLDERIVQPLHQLVSRTTAQDLRSAVLGSSAAPAATKSPPGGGCDALRSPTDIRWVRDQAAARLRQARLETSDGEVADSLTSATASEDGATDASWEDKLRLLSQKTGGAADAPLQLSPGEGLIQRILSGRLMVGQRVKPRPSE